MKKAQILSQPFLYIFAVIVIGLILVFGWTSIKNLIGFGDDVGSVKIFNDFRKAVDEVSKLFPGSSIECSLVRKPLTTENECEIIVPGNIDGICFADTNSPLDFSNIKFKNVEEEIRVYQGTGDRNVFFATGKKPINPIFINKLKPENEFCIDMKTKEKTFILENKGKHVDAKKS